MELTAMVTPHPATCWTSCCRSRRTPTPALDQPPLAPWAQDQALDQVQDLAQDQARAVVHQLVELLAAEQVSIVHSGMTRTFLPSGDLCYFMILLVSDFKVYLFLPVSLCIGSSNTSKYFGSVDSLEQDPKAKAKLRGEGSSEGGQSQVKILAQGEGDHFIKYALQEPLWLLMANADDKVMMTYQMPSR